MFIFVFILGWSLWQTLFKGINTKWHNRFSFIFVNCVIGVFVFGVYCRLGSYDLLKERYSLQAIEKTLISLHETPQLSKAHVISVFKNLETKLTTSEQVWVKLADIYQALHLYEQAVHAYEAALTYHPDFEPYKMQKIYCQVMVKEGKVDQKALSQLKQMLKEYPAHKGVLNLLALHAYQHENYSEALAYWQDILTKSENIIPSEKEAIIKAMDKTRRLLGTLTPPHEFKLSIELDIAPELKHHLAEDDTVFVIAKHLSGDPMPVAVNKQRIGDFPMFVELTDNDIMLEGRLLSSLTDFKLIARVSKSGHALPQAGDLEGELELSVHALSTENILVTINRQL